MGSRAPAVGNFCQMGRKATAALLLVARNEDASVELADLSRLDVAVFLTFATSITRRFDEVDVRAIAGLDSQGLANAVAAAASPKFGAVVRALKADTSGAVVHVELDVTLESTWTRGTTIELLSLAVQPSPKRAIVGRPSADVVGLADAASFAGVGGKVGDALRSAYRCVGPMTLLPAAAPLLPPARAGNTH
jgi:hypothetical protein